METLLRNAKWKWALYGGLALVFGASALWFWWQRPVDEYLLAEQAGMAGGSPAALSDDVWYVHIDGAVKAPGVYQVDANTRLFQLVEQAGGCLDEADLTAF